MSITTVKQLISTAAVAYCSFMCALKVIIGGIILPDFKIESHFLKPVTSTVTSSQ